VLGAVGYELALGSAVGLVPVILLVAFYDLRTRAEETLLSGTYPEYGRYRARVRRFIPRVY